MKLFLYAVSEHHIKQDLCQLLVVVPSEEKSTLRQYAPIIVAVELTFSPTLAIKIAQVRTIKFSIFKVPSALILDKN